MQPTLVGSALALLAKSELSRSAMKVVGSRTRHEGFQSYRPGVGRHRLRLGRRRERTPTRARVTHPLLPTHERDYCLTKVRRACLQFRADPSTGLARSSNLPAPFSISRGPRFGRAKGQQSRAHPNAAESSDSHVYVRPRTPHARARERVPCP
jgi:hypothetical protein